MIRKTVIITSQLEPPWGEWHTYLLVKFKEPVTVCERPNIAFLFVSKGQFENSVLLHQKLKQNDTECKL